MELHIQKIDNELKRLGWTQAELARRLGAKRQWIHAILHPKPGTTLTFKTVNKLADALDLDPRDLIR